MPYILSGLTKKVVDSCPTIQTYEISESARQENGSDCGSYICCYAKAITLGLNVNAIDVRDLLVTLSDDSSNSFVRGASHHNFAMKL